MAVLPNLPSVSSLLFSLSCPSSICSLSRQPYTCCMRSWRRSMVWPDTPCQSTTELPLQCWLRSSLRSPAVPAVSIICSLWSLHCRCSPSTSREQLRRLVSHTPERSTRSQLKFFLMKGQGDSPIFYLRIYVPSPTLSPPPLCREMCLRYAQLETKLGEVDRARAIYSHGSQLSDPRVGVVSFSLTPPLRHTTTFKFDAQICKILHLEVCISTEHQDILEGVAGV